MSHAALLSACHTPLKSGSPSAVRGIRFAAPAFGACAAALIAVNSTNATTLPLKHCFIGVLFLVTTRARRPQLLALRTLVLYSCAQITRDGRVCQDNDSRAVAIGRWDCWDLRGTT